MGDIASKSIFPWNINENCYPGESGITYREWLVGMALSGLVALPGESGCGYELSEIVEMAIETADSTIAQLKEKATSKKQS